jgi:hypothetical protein
MSDADTKPVDGQNDESAPLTSSTNPFRFKLRTLFLLMAGFAVLLTALLGLGRAVGEARASARAAMVHNSIGQIGLGLQNLVSARGSFPPPATLSEMGVPATSWRFQIIPYALQLPNDEEEAVGWHPTASWNDPIHRDIVPYGSDLYVWSGSNENEFTNLFGVSGPDTAFDPARTVMEADVPANVVIAIELARSKTHWMQPGDYNVIDLLAYRGKIADHLHGLLPDRLHILFADGEVWALDPDAPIADLQPFLTITGAKSHDRDQLLGPHKVD